MRLFLFFCFCIKSGSATLFSQIVGNRKLIGLLEEGVEQGQKNRFKVEKGLFGGDATQFLNGFYFEKVAFNLWKKAKKHINGKVDEFR